MSKQFRTQVGQCIRAQREAAGYRNQAEFARRVGISASELSRIERGLRRLDTVLLRRIADVLEVSMDAFFPDESRSLAFARRGDAEDEAMREMISWAVDLRADIDRVDDYLAGRVG